MNAVWSHPKVVGIYTGQRCNAEHLYESERRVLLPILPECSSVLDVGCAAGGFLNIFRTLRPGIHYVGTDRSVEMIGRARRTYPSERFLVNDGCALPFPDCSFDLVFCTGVLHHNPFYARLIHELYRVASRFCVLDLPRLIREPYVFDASASFMVLQDRFDLGEDPPSGSSLRVPYVLANPGPLFRLLSQELSPRPERLAAVGYFGDPGPSVTVPSRPVCYCVVCLFKGNSDPLAPKTAPWSLDLPAKISREIQ